MILGPLHTRLLKERILEEATLCGIIHDKFRRPKMLRLFMVEMYRVIGIGMCSHGFWVWGASSLLLIFSSLAACAALAIHRVVGVCRETMDMPDCCTQARKPSHEGSYGSTAATDRDGVERLPFVSPQVIDPEAGHGAPGDEEVEPQAQRQSDSTS